MINLWVHLSWSHAALVVLLLLLILVLLATFLGKCCSVNEPPARRPSPPVVDYEGAFQEKRDWLGPEHLLHTPVNRIGKSAP